MSMKDSVRGLVSWARMRAWLGMALMTVAAAAVAGFMIGHSVGRHGSTPAGVDVSGLPAYVDRDMAAAAAAAGEPFVYQLRGDDGTGAPCHPRLRMPDGRDYGLERATDGGTGAVLDGGLRQYACGAGMAIPRAAATDTSGMPEYVDREMAAQAAAAGEPFLYQLRDGDVPCWPRLRMPDGRAYGMEDVGTADTGVTPRAGYILQYGCEPAEVVAQLPPR